MRGLPLPGQVVVVFSEKKKLQTIHADALQRLEFEPLVAPVENLVVEGLTLLCGASKVGKSWLCLDLCCSVASGRPFLGRNTMAGDVLYLALEDSPRRLQSRLAALGETPTEALQFATGASLLDAGLLDELADWVTHVSAPRMIVVDTLQKVRGVASSRANMYALDYEAMGRLKAFADAHHVAVVLVHHLSKMRDAADPFDKISGSTGLMGAADTSILIDRERGSNDAKLSYAGRDVWGDDMTLRILDRRWRVVGQDVIDREVYEGDPIVKTVRELLAEGFGGRVQCTLEDFKEIIAQRTGVCAAGTKEALARMLAAKAPDLLRYDGITLERPRVNNKRGVRFSKGGSLTGQE